MLVKVSTASPLLPFKGDQNEFQAICSLSSIAQQCLQAGTVAFASLGCVVLPQLVLRITIFCLEQCLERRKKKKGGWGGRKREHQY